MRHSRFLPHVFLIFCVLSPPALWAQAPAAGTGAVDVAPVVIDGEQLFMLRGITSYPAHQRAHVVRQRIVDLAKNKAFNPQDLRVEIDEDEGVTKIMAGDTMVLGLVDIDAQFEGIDLKLLADTIALRITQAITEYREDRGSDRLLRNGLYALGATAVLILALWGAMRLYTVLHRWAERRVQKSIEDLANKTYNLFHAGGLWQIFAAILRILRLVLIVALIYFYLNAVLGLFPWTRPLAVTLFSLVLDPLKSIALGFVAQLPNLFFLLVLFFVVRYVLKLIRAFFVGIEQGRIRFENFDADWAMPTYKIIRVLVVMFSLVIAYPYIPGSDSMAFKGVSVFIGVLLSLGSSSFISNTIAGLTMTYRGAFKEGDIVRIGDVVGTVDDIRLMITRIRTAKNESVIMPNSNILNTDVINYSAHARDDGLMLNTIVGIGYDAPWRQVEAMLLEAAARTKGLLQEPPPFVLQRSLGDFAVNYELNALCESEKGLLKLYSQVHANIQDVFNEHGVQIMSPHYEADTASPKVIAPENWYPAPATKTES